MSTPTRIVDPATNREALVTKGGALAVAPPSPSQSYNATLGTDDTPVQVVEGRGNESFCITGIILTGNKNISTSIDATVTLYEATADDLTTSLSTILNVPLARSGQLVITGILIEVPKGRFLMAQTSDDDVFVTLLGFYL